MPNMRHQEYSDSRRNSLADFTSAPLAQSQPKQPAPQSQSAQGHQVLFASGKHSYANAAGRSPAHAKDGTLPPAHPAPPLTGAPRTHAVRPPLTQSRPQANTHASQSLTGQALQHNVAATVPGRPSEYKAHTRDPLHKWVPPSLDTPPQAYIDSQLKAIHKADPSLEYATEIIDNVYCGTKQPLFNDGRILVGPTSLAQPDPGQPQWQKTMLGGFALCKIMGATGNSKWGAPIAEYLGDKRPWSGDPLELPQGDYVFATIPVPTDMNQRFTVNSKTYRNSVARHFNYPNPGGKANAAFRIIKGKVWVYALTTIYPGEEILVHYGPWADTLIDPSQDPSPSPSPSPAYAPPVSRQPVTESTRTTRSAQQSAYAAPAAADTRAQDTSTQGAPVDEGKYEQDPSAHTASASTAATAPTVTATVSATQSNSTVSTDNVLATILAKLEQTSRDQQEFQYTITNRMDHNERMMQHIQMYIRQQHSGSGTLDLLSDRTSVHSLEEDEDLDGSILASAAPTALSPVLSSRGIPIDRVTATAAPRDTAAAQASVHSHRRASSSGRKPGRHSRATGTPALSHSAARPSRVPTEGFVTVQHNRVRPRSTVDIINVRSVNGRTVRTHTLDGYLEHKSPARTATSTRSPSVSPILASGNTYAALADMADMDDDEVTEIQPPAHNATSRTHSPGELSSSSPPKHSHSPSSQ